MKSGNIVITGAAPQSLRIDPDGTVTPLDSGIIKLMEPGQNAVMKMSGFTPGTNVKVEIIAPVDVLLLKPGGTTFNLSDYTFDSSDGTYVADGAGVIFVKIGATVTTMTAANTYADGAYQGQYNLDLTVEY